MKLVYGVGINDLPRGSCSVRVHGKVILHSFYKKWSSALQRCYSPKLHQRHPTYIGCSVCEDWQSLSRFKEWFDQHPVERHYWNLDKDLLFPDNKVYSPETCILVPQWLNLFVTERDSARGDHYIGAYLHKPSNRFISQVSDGSGNSKHLGYFTDELSAHLAWKAAKLQIVHDMKTDLDGIDIRVYPALVKRYS